jgi:hypothetical protein
VDPEEDKEEEMQYQDAKRALKAVCGHSHSDSSADEHRKVGHIMLEGSCDITSRRVVKTLRRAVAAATPAPRVAPHHKWMETSINFDASDCPNNMAGAEQLPLFISPTIANIRLYHILVDNGASLNLTSLVAFKKLQIPMSKLAPFHPFSGVGPWSVMLHSSISLPVTFGKLENYRMESILFDITEVNLPFNAILGRLAL